VLLLTREMVHGEEQEKPFNLKKADSRRFMLMFAFLEVALSSLLFPPLALMPVA